MRDLRNIGSKIKFVVMPVTGISSNGAVPVNKKNILRDWDWWGPLLLCLALSIRLSFTAKDEQGPSVFSATFAIIWFGSAVVTLNSQLLGGKMYRNMHLNLFYDGLFFKTLFKILLSKCMCLGILCLPVGCC